MPSEQMTTKDAKAFLLHAPWYAVFGARPAIRKPEQSDKEAAAILVRLVGELR